MGLPSAEADLRNSEAVKGKDVVQVGVLVGGKSKPFINLFRVYGHATPTVCKELETKMGAVGNVECESSTIRGSRSAQGPPLKMQEKGRPSVQ